MTDLVTTRVNHNTIVYQYRSCYTMPLYCTSTLNTFSYVEIYYSSGSVSICLKSRSLSFFDNILHSHLHASVTLFHIYTNRCISYTVSTNQGRLQSPDRQGRQRAPHHPSARAAGLDQDGRAVRRGVPFVQVKAVQVDMRLTPVC